MKVELTIDCIKKLPVGAVPALETELLKRLSKQFDDCKLIIKRASSDGLVIFGGEKNEVERILQETWESADDWFY
ncbi:DinI family protein [Escherichia sp. E1130]|uniref:DinI family protein n=1 Tax=Escherichia sp. E1130 TaxID=2041645 RepID=UPI001080493E|nr:DinI family protein [Escherichia sp. E1130]TGC25856.1 DNA damage-inducible protein I [Escherichia sp. E1130]TLI75862.1 DinI family protein [Escherichia sp. E1130]